MTCKMARRFCAMRKGNKMITIEECQELANRLSIAWPEPQNPLQLFYMNGVVIDKEKIGQLDFTDARAVLRQALQMDYWEDFLTNIDGIPGYDEHADVVPVDLVVDTTGKLAKLLLEYLRSKEHDSDHAMNHIDEVFNEIESLSASEFQDLLGKYKNDPLIKTLEKAKLGETKNEN